MIPAAPVGTSRGVTRSIEVDKDMLVQRGVLNVFLAMLFIFFLVCVTDMTTTIARFFFLDCIRCVEVVVVHVGGTRTFSSTDHMMTMLGSCELLNCSLLNCSLSFDPCLLIPVF